MCVCQCCKLGRPWWQVWQWESLMTTMCLSCLCRVRPGAAHAGQRAAGGAVHRRHQAVVSHPRQDAQEGLGQHGELRAPCTVTLVQFCPRCSKYMLKGRHGEHPTPCIVSPGSVLLRSHQQMRCSSRKTATAAVVCRVTSSSWGCGTTRTRRQTLS